MNQSLRIAKIFGIPVQVHWSFGLLIAWIGYLGYEQGWTLRETLFMGGFVLILFVCVILHEFGHALTARRYGVGTRDITISPIGGIARLDRMPEKPFQELMVAIAGPLVNVAISGILSVVYLAWSGAGSQALQHSLYGVILRDSNFLPGVSSVFELSLITLIALNGTLAVFNMLPAFPMDGGRVLRALLSIHWGRSTATRIAAWLGQFLAVGLALYGAYTSSFVTIFIGGFVFLAAAQEHRAVRTEEFLSQYKVSDVIRTQFSRFFTFDSVSLPAQAMLHGLEQYVLIFDPAYRVVGSLSETVVLMAIKEELLDAPIESLPLLPAPEVSPTQTLKEVLHIFQMETAPILPVVENGVLIGVVDQPMVEHFLRRQKKR
jgi:Zn-dependent protease